MHAVDAAFDGQGRHVFIMLWRELSRRARIAHYHSAPITASLTQTAAIMFVLENTTPKCEGDNCVEAQPSLRVFTSPRKVLALFARASRGTCPFGRHRVQKLRGQNRILSPCRRFVNRSREVWPTLEWLILTGMPAAAHP